MVSCSDGKDYKALYEDAVKESRKWKRRSKDNLEQLNALKQSRGKARPDHRGAHRRAREGERRPQGRIGAGCAGGLGRKGDGVEPIRNAPPDM